MMRRFIQIVFVIGLIFEVILFYYAFKYHVFSNPAALQHFIGQFGSFGVIVFILTQIVQPICPLIPGGLSDVAGILMYGNILGLIYVCIGLVIGEVIVFLLVRKYGEYFLKKFLSNKAFERVIKFTNSKEHMQKLIIIIFLIPFGPDDLICMAAGLSKISFNRYFWTITLLKPISVGVHCYIMISIFKVV